MGQQKKITVDVDSDELGCAQAATKASISETVRLGLRLLGASTAYRKALKLQGKIKFSKTWKELKEDR